MGDVARGLEGEIPTVGVEMVSFTTDQGGKAVPLDRILTQIMEVSQWFECNDGCNYSA